MSPEPIEPAPIAVLPVADELAVSPRAMLEVPLAVLSAPRAVEESPLALVCDPRAVASLFDATESSPIDVDSVPLALEF